MLPKVIQVEYDWEVPINFTGVAEEVRDGYCWSRQWYKDGFIHREDGPAVEYSSGEKQWFLNGHRHREDGPAIEWECGPIEGLDSWYLKGRGFNDKEVWKQKLKELCH